MVMSLFVPDKQPPMSDFGLPIMMRTTDYRVETMRLDDSGKVIDIVTLGDGSVYLCHRYYELFHKKIECKLAD